jgi:hypothetical protein
VIDPSTLRNTMRAKLLSTVLEFDPPHQATFLGVATSSAFDEQDSSSTANWSIGAQAAYSRHKPWLLRRVGLALVLVANSALAEREPAECIAEHAGAQELADAGRLSEAQKKFESCAKSDCPKLIQKDCTALGAAVEQSIPTLSVTAIGQNGQALPDFGIELDGVALPRDASHRPMTLDPGDHRIKVIVAGYQPTEVTIPVHQKERHQSAVIQLAAPDAGSAKARNAGYVLAGVGTVGLLSFVGFAISGHVDQSRLETNSGRSGVANDYGLADRMHRKYLIADVSLGIGLVSLGTATYLLLVTRGAADNASTAGKTALFVQSGTTFSGIGLRSEF